MISGLLTYYNEKSCDFQNYKISRLFLSEIWYDQWESHHKTSTYSPQVKNSDAFWLNIPLFYRFCNYLYNPVYINIQSATVLVVKWEAFRPVFLSVIAKNLYLIIFSLDHQPVFFDITSRIWWIISGNFDEQVCQQVKWCNWFLNFLLHESLWSWSRVFWLQVEFYVARNCQKQVVDKVFCSRSLLIWDVLEVLTHQFL